MDESAKVTEAIAQLDLVREQWLARVDVVGCDVGYNYVDGQRSDEIVIRVHVYRPATLPEADPFPTRLGDFRVIIIEALYGFEEGEG